MKVEPLAGGWNSLGEQLAALSGKKVNYADLFVQSASGHSVTFEKGRVEEVSSGASGGVGARVLLNDHSVFSHSPDSSLKGAWLCMEETLSRAGLPSLRTPSFTPADFTDCDPIRLKAPETEPLGEVDRSIRNASNHVRQVTLRAKVSGRRTLIVRGDGKIVTDLRFHSLFAVQVTVERKGTIQTGYEVRAFQTGPGNFWDDLSPLEVGRQALERALLMLEASQCPAGRMPVVLSGQAGGTMIHEACGHGLEADIVQKDYSVYRDRLGEQVASPLVTLVDDATIPRAYGSYEADDEGTPSQRTILIDRGVLKAYLTDVQSAQKGGLPLTGNGRRGSYRNLPLPRMSNTFLLPGEDPFESLLDKAGKGLLVTKMGGGQVNPTSGDFVFQVTEAFLIENGRVGKPVRGATLIGNGPETLKQIEAIGGDLHFEPGLCGKDGQSVPVTDGQPSLLIRDLLVGGCEIGDGEG
ncbi:MAG: TldD/PmbA family protein [Synergistaceae bacterium]|nr:TldD/PmbA family protein [Synergistaceae bacterium]